jgi:hypothetical protein
VRVRGLACGAVELGRLNSSPQSQNSRDDGSLDCVPPRGQNDDLCRDGEDEVRVRGLACGNATKTNHLNSYLPAAGMMTCLLV